MREKRAGKRTIKYMIILLCVLLCVPVCGMLARAALESDKDTGVRSVQVKDADIEASTLVIGSHLIHIQGLSEAIYEVAVSSANEFDQNHLYYKSELANGQWFEITDATSLADITTAGTPVDRSVIEALEFTHKTNAQGVTTDLRTGEAVSAYNVNSPYDMNVMEELQPVRVQYDMLTSKPEDSRTYSDNEYIRMIQELFAQDLQSEECVAYDGYIEALERYKADLNGREASVAWLDEVDNVMETVDAARRVLVFYRLGDMLDDLTYRAQGIVKSKEESEEGTEGESEEGTEEGTEEGSVEGTEEGSEEGTEGESEEESGGKTDENLVINSEVISAIGESINLVASSLASYEVKLLTEGTTVISRTRYQTSNDLIIYAQADDYGNSDSSIARLCALQNIMNEKVVDAAQELSILDSELIPQTKKGYEDALAAGADSGYVRALAEGVAALAAEAFLKEQKTEAERLRGDYETMLTAKWMRMSNEDAQADVLGRLDELPALAERIQADDSYVYLNDSLTSHELWLRENYGRLVADGSASTEMDDLQAKKEDLETQYQDALDKNNLAEAERLRALLAALQARLDALEKSYLDILNSKNSSESDKAKAAAGLGDGTSASAMNGLADGFIDALKEKDAEIERLKQLLDALKELAKLNPQAASSALDKISDALSDGSGTGNGETDDGGTDGSGTDGDGTGDGGTDGSGTNGNGLTNADMNALKNTVTDMQLEVGDATKNSEGATMSAVSAKELLDAVLNDLFGMGYDDMNAMQKAQALIALEWYGEQTRNENIASLAASLANEQASEGSYYLYEKYAGGTGNYLSLKSAGMILGYRVIFDSVHSVETLSWGLQYYEFRNARTAYEQTGQTTQMLGAAAGLQSRQLYIAAADAKKIFELEAEAIDRADYAVAYTADMRAVAEQILKALQEGGS